MTGPASSDFYRRQRMTGQKKLKQRLSTAFDEQGGRCFWCFGACRPPYDGAGMRPPPAPNEATADHLYPKAPDLPRPKHRAFAIVMACRACNGARGTVWNYLLNDARKRGRAIVGRQP